MDDRELIGETRFDSAFRVSKTKCRVLTNSLNRRHGQGTFAPTGKANFGDLSGRYVTAGSVCSQRFLERTVIANEEGATI